MVVLLALGVATCFEILGIYMDALQGSMSIADTVRQGPSRPASGAADADAI